MSTDTAGLPGLSSLDRRVPAIDGLRGTAVLLILLYHFPYLYRPWTVPADGVLVHVQQALWCGVDLFFVISGFLITGILLDTKGRAGYFRNFYARRALRILPLYYAVLALLVILLPRLPLASPLETVIPGQLWLWSFLANFRFAYEGVLPPGTGHLWSLAIEEQFYLLWPAVVALVPRRRLIALGAAVMLGSLGLRIAMVAAHAGWVATYAITPARIDSIVAGALLAALAREPGGLGRIARPLRAAGWAAVALLAIILVVRRGLATQDPVVQTLGYSAFAVAFGALLVNAVVAPPASRLGRYATSPVLALFGRYSYAMYLFHFPIIFIAESYRRGATSVPRLRGWQLPGQALFTAAGIAVTLGLAMLSWHLFEKQFIKLKRYFRYANEPSAPDEDESLRAEGEALAGP